MDLSVRRTVTLTWQATWIVLLVLLAFGREPLWSQGSAGSTASDAAEAGPGEVSTADPQTAQAAPPASRAEQISETQLSGLPLNGRSYNQLATLQGGVSDPSTGSASRGGGSGNLTVVGGRATSNSFLLDGTYIMDAQNRVPQSAAGVQLGSDSVLEVEVLTSQYGPEHGRTSGGVLNSITRSGSPEFHGTLFEYFRNSNLDARNYFDPGPEPTPFKRNQFGATVTGPIWKDRTFFMASYEGLRDRLTETNVNFFPDALARQGILTDCSGNVLQEVQILNPATGQLETGVHPAVKPYLDIYPLPDSDCRGGGIAEKAGAQFQPTSENFFTFRVDHKLSDRDSLFVRYTFDDASSESGDDNFLWNQINESRQQYLTMVLSHIFNPQRLITARLGYTRPSSHTDIVGLVDIPQSLFFVPDSPNFGQILVPSMTPLGVFPSQPGFNITNTFQGSSDVIIQSGPHSLRLGGQAHRYRWDGDSLFMKAGQWRFNSLASFLQAGPEGTNLQVSTHGSNHREFRQTLLGLYVQDQIRITPRFSMNLGLRYDYLSLISEKNGEFSYLVNPLTDAEPQTGSLLSHNPARWNFAPRIGFRWSPSSGGRTVLQVGAGLYYDHIIGYTVVARKNTAPFWNTVTNPNFDASTTFPDALAAASLPGATPPNIHMMDYFDMKTPRVVRYSFSIQQEIAPQWNAQASYIGARGINLLRRYEFNLFPQPIVRPDGSLCFPPDETQVRPQDIRPGCPAVSPAAAGPRNPHRGTVQMLSSDANSFYNSMQLSLNGRFGQAISMQARYTYSKSVDDASNGPNGGISQFGPIRTHDRGLSDFDIRHRLSMNYFWTPPLGSGQRWLNSGLLSALLGDWRIGGIVSYRTGIPTTIAVNVITQGYLFEPTRPNLLPGQSINPTDGVTAGCTGFQAGRELGTPDLYFDPCVFSLPDPGTLGNLGRNTVIAPSIFNADVSLQKEFSIDSVKRLQFRAELFNLFNHPNFNPNQGNTAVVFSGRSGRLNSSAGRLSQSSGTARQLQFALRFSF